MRKLGIHGVIRGKSYKMTVAELGAERPADLVERTSTATAPNRLWVADIKFVATWRGPVYVAFVIDVFSRMIVGWRVGKSISVNSIHRATGRGRHRIIRRQHRRLLRQRHGREGHGRISTR